MEMPKPGPEHARLARFAANWTGEERMYPSPWDPSGGSAQATLRGRATCDGFWIVGDYEQRRAGAICFQGHSVMGYDAQAGEVTLHWFDSMGLGVDVLRGKFSGDTLAPTSRNPMGVHRLTHDLREPETLRSRMGTSRDGQTWTPMFDGVYRLER